MSRHATLYFSDGSLTLKAGDGTIFNVYRHNLILKSDLFSGMLTLPIPNHPPLSLSNSTREMIEKAKNAGLDGTSDATAVLLPQQFTSAECAHFLEFIFNTPSWTEKVPQVDVLYAILKTSHFFGTESGIDYAVHYLEDHEELKPALRFRMGCDYDIRTWVTQAFDALMAVPIHEISQEEEELIGANAIRVLARTQGELTDHRVTLAVCPPEPWHVNWCYNKGNCIIQWEKAWTTTVLNWLLKEELPGSVIEEKLDDLSAGTMNGECRILTCTNLKRPGPAGKSLLTEEESIVDKGVAALGY